MRILYFHQYFNTPKGTGGTRSYEMAKRLVEAGHNVTMICASTNLGSTGIEGDFIKGKRVGVYENIEIIEFDLKYSNYDSLLKRTFKFLKYSWNSIKLIFSLKYDVIFATTTPLTAGIPGIIGKIFKGKPFIFEVRDLWPELPKAMKVVTNPFILWGMSILEYLSYNTANACIGLAPGIVEGIKKRLRNKKKEVALIPNGSDLKLFADKSLTYSHPEINDSDFIAVFTGAHGKANGLDAVLDAAKILIDRGVNNIKILFVGDGKMKPHLLKRKEKEGLNNCIFANPIQKKDMPSLLNRADLGLMILDNIPAFYNGTSPNKFFDYLAAGLPILNNYPGWVSKYISEYDCGYPIEPNDSKLFAETLIKASKDKKEEQLLQYGKNAKKLAEEKFDRDILANKFVEVIGKYGE